MLQSRATVIAPSFNEFYIIKQNGVCFFSCNNGASKHGEYYQDLVTPFLSAIDMFAAENLDGRQVRCIEMDDGMKVYFKNVKLDENTTVKVVIIFPEGFHEFKNVDKRVHELRWELNKWVKDIHSCNSLPYHAESMLKRKIETTFSRDVPTR